ncbi:hypothetical protein MB27_21670 [Actinoplanes utahensis]|uniref:Uncharacterized protein n=3 Tax=Actinoplanes utahensis TaxID=1869 RepID=A0A0A6UHU0_ACTUT|nr:hypothetical protein MB27_21670 [Actinoplanes utahensis]
MVASDGFTAEVGGMVEMPLSLYCRYRTRLSADDDRRPAASSIPGDHRHPETRSVHDLVGRAVAMESTVWTAGWMLDVDGLGIYVSEADTGPSPGSSAFEVYREAGSDPAAPVPEPGTWTRVRGQLSIAEPYETGAYEPEAELLRHAVRTWLVHRIVRLDGRSGSGGLPQGRGEDVTVVQHTGLRYSAAWSTLGYLLDLEHADHEGP